MSLITRSCFFGIEQLLLASDSTSKMRLLLTVNIDTNEVKYEVRHGIKVVDTYQNFADALSRFNSETQSEKRNVY